MEGGGVNTPFSAWRDSHWGAATPAGAGGCHLHLSGPAVVCFCGKILRPPARPHSPWMSDRATLNGRDSHPFPCGPAERLHLVRL